MNDIALVVGGDGLIGRALVNYFLKINQPTVATTRQPVGIGKDCIFLDLERPELWQIPPFVESAVLCAAITDISYCRENPDQAKKINLDNILLLARELNNRGVFVTFLSTNLVFDGTISNTSPTAHMNPQTIYGNLKAETEIQLADLFEHIAIIRLTKVFYSGINIINDWEKRLNLNKVIRPFSDYRCAPIDLQTTVKGIAQITLNHLPGIWQFSPECDVGYSDIALEVAYRNKADMALVKPVVSSTEATLEHVPKHTTLDASRSHSELDLNFKDMPTILDGILGLA